jgi:hypothetical protein
MQLTQRGGVGEKAGVKRKKHARWLGGQQTAENNKLRGRQLILGYCSDENIQIMSLKARIHQNISDLP